MCCTPSDSHFISQIVDDGLDASLDDLNCALEAWAPVMG